MKLYYFAGACSLADHIVLEWIGEPYETVRMTLASVKSREYLALNPNGTVPLLVDGDFVLTQNVAILCYLADRHPTLMAARRRLAARPRGGHAVARLPELGRPPGVQADLRAEPLPGGSRPRRRDRRHGTRARADLPRPHRQAARGPALAHRRTLRRRCLFVRAVALGRSPEVGLDGFANLSRFADRMYADPAVRTVIQAEESAVDLAA